MINPSLPLPLLLATIAGNFVKAAFWAELTAFLATLELTRDELATRIATEAATVAALPNELAFRTTIPGIGEVSMSACDVQVIYAAHVAGLVATGAEDASYQRSLWDWMNEQNLTDEAVSDGACLFPLWTGIHVSVAGAGQAVAPDPSGINAAQGRTSRGATSQHSLIDA